MLSTFCPRPGQPIGCDGNERGRSYAYLRYGGITGLIIGAPHNGLKIMGKTGRKPQPLRDSSGREIPSFISETDKLPKGQSYPLKPMKLAEVLSAEGISI